MSAREDLLFAPAHRELARALYAQVDDLPLICPHGHVDPWLLADPQATLGTPAELFVIADHYVLRLLHSQGVRLEQLGVATRDGEPVEGEHRQIWQQFAERIELFAGTATGLWLALELRDVFGVDTRLSAACGVRKCDRAANRPVSGADRRESLASLGGRCGSLTWYAVERDRSGTPPEECLNPAAIDRYPGISAKNRRKNTL